MFHTDEYIQLTRLILKAVPAEKIFLLGTTQVQRRTESIFVTEATKHDSVEHYYILVLIRRNRECINNTVQEKIESHCNATARPVTAIVIDIEQFNDWLLEGHPFAVRVKTKALPLYDNLNTILADPVTFDKDALQKANEIAFSQGLNKVQEFLAGVDLYRIREQNKMVAFMLHQATEQALGTLLKIGIGFHTCTHNIERLLRYGSMVVYQLPDVFPRKTEHEKRLFNLLQKAYIDARYKADYTINFTDLLLLTEKVRRIQEILVDAGKTHIPSIGRG